MTKDGYTEFIKFFVDGATSVNNNENGTINYNNALDGVTNKLSDDIPSIVVNGEAISSSFQPLSIHASSFHTSKSLSASESFISPFDANIHPAYENINTFSSIPNSSSLIETDQYPLHSTKMNINESTDLLNLSSVHLSNFSGDGLENANYYDSTASDIEKHLSAYYYCDGNSFATEQAQADELQRSIKLKEMRASRKRMFTSEPPKPDTPPRVSILELFKITLKKTLLIFDCTEHSY